MRAKRLLSGLLLTLVAAGLAQGCSGKTAPAKGQVMVVLQSDMAIPKDINRVRVDISVRGQIKYSNTFVADNAGEFTLPGTIAIVAGEEETPQVEVKVVGINQDLEAQTFSKVITTIPRERIAMLRVPMQWLCTGEVLQDGMGPEASYESACQAAKGSEQSCVAGSCVSVEVPEPDLPTYSPPEVFGGGEFANDPSGKCFDVQGCFQLGVDLLPDLNPKSATYCQAAVQVPEDFSVNFAVKTPPGGAGVCDDQDDEAPCYVVLDQSETFGWAALEGAGGAPIVDGSPDGSGGSGGGGVIAPRGGSTGAGGAAVPAGGGPAGGSSTAGAGFGGSPPADFPYLETGNWYGHVITTITGPGSVFNGLSLQGGFPLCADGIVGGVDGMPALALVGFNLKQPNGGAPDSVLPLNPTGGLTVDLSDNEGGSTMQVVLRGPNADVDPNQNWCATAANGINSLSWGDFTSCTGLDITYNPHTDLLASISVMVEGGTADIPFDFCINDVVEELPIGQRRATGAQPQGLPFPPGVRPLQAGGGEVTGSVLVQFPTAVCDRLIADAELGLRATAACDTKTEATPICGPWSSVPEPDVPNPEGSLPGMSGEGGAGGAPSDGGTGEGGADSGGIGLPAYCLDLPAHETTEPVIADFDQDVLQPSIDMVDGRMGYAFPIGHGACEPGQVIKGSPGAEDSSYGLHFMGGSCVPSPADGDAEGLVVTFNSNDASVPEGTQPIPSEVCPYDASAYTAVSFWARADQGTGLNVLLITPDTLPPGDPLPGGICQTHCQHPSGRTDIGTSWSKITMIFDLLGIDPSRIIGLEFQPTTGPDAVFYIDNIAFETALP